MAFDVQFGEVKCSTTKYAATTEASTYTAITMVAPTYEGCFLAGVATTYDLNGCYYLFHLNNEGPPYAGTFDVTCPEGKEITITGGTKCTLHIPAQTGIGPIVYRTIGVGATRELTIDFSGATNVKYSQTPGTAAEKCESITTSAGQFTGSATVTGENGKGAHVGLSVSNLFGSTQFHTEAPESLSATTIFTGTQEGSSNAFDVQYGEVKCTTADYVTTTEVSTYTTMAMTPVNEGCTFAGVATTYDVNGCYYLFHLDNEGPPYAGTFDVTCPEGKEITITGGTKCTLHIPPQSGIGPITYTTIGSGSTRELTIDFSGATNVKYSQTAGTSVGKCESLTASAGKYTGTATFTGEDNEGAHVGLFVGLAGGSAQFHTESPLKATALTGVQEGESNGFDLQYGEVKCKTTKYAAATEKNTFTTFEMKPTYEDCTLAGEAGTYDVNGCHYLFHLNNEGPPYKGTFDILCPAGKEITITGGTKCTVHIPAQTGIGPITYATIGSGSTRELTIDFSGATNVKYSQTAGTDPEKCNALSPSRYTGTATVTAENGKGTHLGTYAELAGGSAQFHTESSPEATTLTGNQEGTSTAFDVQHGEVKCTTAKFASTTEASTYTTIAMTPTYAGCTFAGVAATYDLNGCSYLFHINNESPPFKGTLDVVCPEGQELTITGGTKCTLHIPPQTGIGPIVYTTIGSGSTRELTIDFSGATNAKSSQTPGTASVGKCSALSSSPGKSTGTATITGESYEGAHLGLYVSSSSGSAQFHAE
jgi:hypothetical protein